MQDRIWMKVYVKPVFDVIKKQKDKNKKVLENLIPPTY